MTSKSLRNYIEKTLPQKFSKRKYHFVNRNDKGELVLKGERVLSGAADEDGNLKSGWKTATSKSKDGTKTKKDNSKVIFIPSLRIAGNKQDIEKFLSKRENEKGDRELSSEDINLLVNSAFTRKNFYSDEKQPSYEVKYSTSRDKVKIMEKDSKSSFKHNFLEEVKKISSLRQKENTKKQDKKSKRIPLDIWIKIAEKLKKDNVSLISKDKSGKSGSGSLESFEKMLSKAKDKNHYINLTGFRRNKQAKQGFDGVKTISEIKKDYVPLGKSFPVLGKDGKYFVIKKNSVDTLIHFLKFISPSKVKSSELTKAVNSFFGKESEDEEEEEEEEVQSSSKKSSKKSGKKNSKKNGKKKPSSDEGSSEQEESSEAEASSEEEESSEEESD